MRSDLDDRCDDQTMQFVDKQRHKLPHQVQVLQGSFSPILLYVWKTRTLHADTEHMIQAFENKCLQGLFRIFYMEHTIFALFTKLSMHYLYVWHFSKLQLKVGGQLKSSLVYAWVFIEIIYEWNCIWFITELVCDSTKTLENKHVFDEHLLSEFSERNMYLYDN